MLYDYDDGEHTYVGTFLDMLAAKEYAEERDLRPHTWVGPEGDGVGLDEGVEKEGGMESLATAADHEDRLWAAARHEAGHAFMGVLSGRRRVKYACIEPDGSGFCDFHRQPSGTIWGPELIEAFVKIDVAGSLAEGADPVEFDWRSLNEIDREVIDGEYHKFQEWYGDEPEAVIRRLVFETDDALFSHILAVEALAEELVVRR